MNEEAQTPAETIEHELESLQKDWWWFLLLGILLIVLGSIAVGCAPFATLVTAVTFGVILILGGAAQIVSSFWAGRWSGFLLHLMIGILYVVVGFIVVEHPAEAAAGLTLLIAAVLVVAGIFRIIAALYLRFPDWGWAALSGTVSIILGLLIHRGWPATGLIAIGLFVGIEMIFNGWYWVMLGLDLRRFGKKVEAAAAA